MNIHHFIMLFCDINQKCMFNEVYEQTNQEVINIAHVILNGGEPMDISRTNDLPIIRHII